MIDINTEQQEKDFIEIAEKELSIDEAEYLYEDFFRGITL